MATALLVVGLLFSAAVFHAMDRNYSAQRQLSQRTTFRNIVEDIATRFDLYAYGLRALRNFAAVDTLPAMTRRNFEIFVNSKNLSVEFPGARGIGVIRYLHPDQVDRFLAEKSAIDGYRDFRIRQFAPHEGARFVIQYVAPREPNREAIGLDISSEAVREAAAMSAVARDQATLSGPIRLVQAEAGDMTGLLILLPVFRNGAPIATQQERMEALEGWTYSPLVVDEVVADIMARYNGWRVSILDAQASSAAPLYDTRSKAGNPASVIEASINVHGRLWKIAGSPELEGLSATGHYEQYVVAGATFLLFALIASVVYVRTRHLAKEQQLSIERSRLADIVAHASDAMLSTDVDGRIVSWNAAACRLFQLTDAEAHGCDVRTLVTDHPDPIFAGLKEGRELPDGGLMVKTPCKRRDGTTFPALIAFFALGSGRRQLGISIRDMSDQQAFEQCILELTHKLKAEVQERTSQLDQSLALQAEIHHLAMHDPLTGLANRTLFRDRLLAAVDLHMAEAQQTFALLALDLDRFKPVNDTYGHPMGDILLVQIGERLRACLSREDTAARLGGDEFAILLKPGTTKAEALATAKCVLDAIEKPFNVDGLVLEIGVSIGITVHDDTMRHVNADDFFKLADHALYTAKRDGRGGYHLCEDLQDAQGPHASRIAIEMREALRRGEFHLQYQPIIDCALQRLDGFEALLRWKHATRGPTSPAEFIPVAEESDQIIPIGEWALRAACEEAAGWDDNVNISVNVSPIQIKRPGWDDSVIAVLAETGLDPSRLIIEVTESVLMADSAAVLDRLKRVQDFGVAIALDDFGTGYSSLSYLRKFRFDKLKIDKSFMRDSGEFVCAAIIRCIVRLGRQLSVTVVAEGIETERQLKLIEREGCSHAQGYYFSRPLDPAAARTYMEDMRQHQSSGLENLRQPTLLKTA